MDALNTQLLTILASNQDLAVAKHSAETALAEKTAEADKLTEQLATKTIEVAELTAKTAKLESKVSKLKGACKALAHVACKETARFRTMRTVYLPIRLTMTTLGLDETAFNLHVKSHYVLMTLDVDADQRCLAKIAMPEDKFMMCTQINGKCVTIGSATCETRQYASAGDLVMAMSALADEYRAYLTPEKCEELKKEFEERSAAALRTLVEMLSARRNARSNGADGSEHASSAGNGTSSATTDGANDNSTSNTANADAGGTNATIHSFVIRCVSGKNAAVATANGAPDNNGTANNAANGNHTGGAPGNATQ
jgi:hypothetical protein